MNYIREQNHFTVSDGKGGVISLTADRDGMWVSDACYPALIPWSEIEAARAVADARDAERRARG